MKNYNKKGIIVACMAILGIVHYGLSAQNIESEENKGVSMNINIGIDEKNREAVAQKLRVLLANEYLLYTKTFKFHWNVESTHFGDLHKTFQGHYEQLAGFVDGVAERIRALGIAAPGTLAEFMQYATLTEEPGKNPDDQGMIRILLDGHEHIIRQLREDLSFTEQQGDMGTNNFLNDLIEKHEKTAWMLRSTLAR